MTQLFKAAAGRILIPFTKWYLRKTRTFRFEDIQVKVFAGVFHPGLFSSTLFILEFLKTKDLRTQTLLELGCGSGLISVACARAGAIVTASDISAKAIENCRENALSNNVQLDIIQSDLFANISAAPFDWIIINPPYYARDPRHEEEFAWNCGKNFEYFRNLFEEIRRFIHENTFILMVLTKGCDLESIFAIAQRSGFRFEMLQEKNVPFDQKDYLFRIRLNSFA